MLAFGCWLESHFVVCSNFFKHLFLTTIIYLSRESWIIMKKSVNKLQTLSVKFTLKVYSDVGVSVNESVFWVVIKDDFYNNKSQLGIKT